MKKSMYVILLLIFTLFVVIFQIKSNKQKIVQGNPIFNNTITDSKRNDTFISSYECVNNKLFGEIWIEKKAYKYQDKNKFSNIFLLNFSLKNNHETNLIISNTNFKYLGYGYNGRIFTIEISDKKIIELDSLNINFILNSQYTSIKLIKLKTS